MIQRGFLSLLFCLYIYVEHRGRGVFKDKKSRKNYIEQNKEQKKKKKKKERKKGHGQPFPKIGTAILFYFIFPRDLFGGEGGVLLYVRKTTKKT